MAGSVPGTDVGAAGPRIGDVIDGRYRLEAPATLPANNSDDGGVLWSATDLVLSRPVAIRILVTAEPTIRAAFLAAATTSCRVADPMLAATYDAAEFGDPSNPLGAYVVREWVPGQTLADLLQEGPLDPERAATVLRDVSVAVAHLHERGVAHGQLHPSNVLIRPDGQIRLADAALGMALRDAHLGDPSTRDLATDTHADTVALGKTLYATLTGRWPTGTWRDLESAPRSKTEPDRPLTARQIQAGVSRELDALTSQILGIDPATENLPPMTAAQVAAALDHVLLTAPGPAVHTSVLAAVPPLARPPISRQRRRIRFLVVATVIVLVGIGVAGLLGVAQNNSPSVPTFTPPATNAGSAAPGGPIPFASVVSFDPPPGDGVENPSHIDAMHDGQLTTAWETETYATANLGNAKPGVGLLIDLGSSRTVSNVRLDFLRAGTDVDIRAMSQNASVAGTTLADFPLVARRLNTEKSVDLPVTTTARFWLVWLTKLPPAGDGSGFRSALAEVVMTSP